MFLGRKKQLNDFLGNSSENEMFQAQEIVLWIIVPNCPRADKPTLVQKQGMALDVRLACLMVAIREDWADLEAKEVNGTIVVRLKDNVEVEELHKKRGRPPWLHTPE